MPTDLTGADVAVVEDVWGKQFEDLAVNLQVVRDPDAWSDAPDLPRRLAGVRALVVRNRTQVTAELLAALPDLEVVARAGVGLDNIDVECAERLGVVVIAAYGVNACSVAEYTVGAAIVLARQLTGLDRRTRNGEWTRTPGRELAGRTWGLLGLGATGRRVAALAAALDMKTIAHDPYLTEPSDVRTVGLDEVVAAADVLSLHVPVTEQTRGLIDAAFLGRMKSGALLVNVARGEVVDEDALADALESGALGGAALDVRATEPPKTGRLEQLDNVVLTPHVAGITGESQHRITGILAADIASVLGGGSAQHAVGISRPRLGRRTA